MASCKCQSIRPRGLPVTPVGGASSASSPPLAPRAAADVRPGAGGAGASPRALGRLLPKRATSALLPPGW
eukprot:4072447-Pyramimonas_sp.AAC.1